MTIALDATYSVGRELSGVGNYSREILYRLAESHPEAEFRFCYRPHRLWQSLRAPWRENVRKCVLQEPLSPGGDLFHGLNQRLPKVKLRRAVCTFHDLFVLTGDYSTAEFRRRFAKQARDAAARSDAIISVSAFTASQVADLLGFERSRIHVAHHGVRALPPAEFPREDIVLHVGAIQKRKNLGRLVEAFERMPAHWRLILAGSAGYGSQEVLDRIERSPAKPRIRITGYIPDAELAAWYQRAKIFAFPSLDEGFGMPVLEAMAAGVAVVSSSQQALAEVCGQAALLVDPFDTDALGNALMRMAHDGELREFHIRLGRQRAAKFTWSDAVAKTWRVYESLF